MTAKGGIVLRNSLWGVALLIVTGVWSKFCRVIEAKLKGTAQPTRYHAKVVGRSPSPTDSKTLTYEEHSS